MNISNDSTKNERLDTAMSSPSKNRLKAQSEFTTGGVFVKYSLVEVRHD